MNQLSLFLPSLDKVLWGSGEPRLRHLGSIVLHSKSVNPCFFYWEFLQIFYEILSIFVINTFKPKLTLMRNSNIGCFLHADFCILMSEIPLIFSFGTSVLTDNFQFFEVWTAEYEDSFSTCDCKTSYALHTLSSFLNEVCIIKNFRPNVFIVTLLKRKHFSISNYKVKNSLSK